MDNGDDQAGEKESTQSWEKHELSVAVGLGRSLSESGQADELPVSGSFQQAAVSSTATRTSSVEEQQSRFFVDLRRESLV